MGLFEISAIICTHNRAAYLRKALDSLLKQTLNPASYEIIVVDNASTDATEAVVKTHFRHANLRHVPEPRLGLSHARNTGWRNASAPYVAYLDDDAIAEPDWLANILAAFERIKPEPGCVGGRALPLWGAERPSWLSDDLATSLTIIDWTEEPILIADLREKWLVGANIAFPVRVLESVGGFTNGLDRAGSSLLSGGDVYIEHQIIRSGRSCYYDPAITVYHYIEEVRLCKPWFHRRYFWQGISDAAMQLLDENLTGLKRFLMAMKKSWSLLRSPSKLRLLIRDSDDPNTFTEKCFTLIAVGHIAGLLWVLKR